MTSTREVLLVLISGLTFSLVAGVWTFPSLVLCGVALASLWLTWRYETVETKRFFLPGILELPFLLLVGKTVWSSAHPIEIALEATVVGGAYLLLRTVVELYRKAEQARWDLVRFGAFALMIIGGVSQKNSYYLFSLAFFAAVLLFFPKELQSKNVKKDSFARRSYPIWLVCCLYALNLVLAHYLIASFPVAKGVWEAQADVYSGPESPKNDTFGVGSDLWSLEGLTNSKEPVARVFGPKTWLRGRVRPYYESRRWRKPPSSLYLVDELPGHFDFTIPRAKKEGQASQRWTVQPLQPLSGPLLVPEGTYRLIADAPVCELGPSSQLFCRTQESYQVFAIQDKVQGADVSLKRPLPGSWRWRFYLETPVPLDGVLDEMAEKMAGSLTEPSEIAQAVEHYLSQNGSYSNEFDPMQLGYPMETFLRGDLTGRSELFATSMALILRRRGIATRYVTGYRLLEKNMWGGYYMVRERDAYAWVEVLLEDGWKSFDPTPRDSILVTHPDGFRDWSSKAFLDNIRARVQQVQRWLESRDWVKTAALLLALSLSFIGLKLFANWLQVKKQKAAQIEPERAKLQGLFQRAVSELKLVGVVREHWETPLEFSHKAQEHRQMAQWLAEYSQARFGGVDSETLSDLEKNLELASESLRK